MNQFSDAQLIEQYLKIRQLKAEMAERHKAELAPLDGAMDTIEGVMSARLIERGANNSKTDAGTAYRSRVVKYKVVDQNAFREYLLATGNWDQANLSTLKEGMDTYVETNGTLPPGTDATAIESTNFRKA